MNSTTIKLEGVPFLPLTQGGAKQAVVEEMLLRLAGEHNRDIVAIGCLFASRAFQKAKNVNGLLWLDRRIWNMNDFLRDSPFYQRILAESESIGEAKGLATGILQGMRQAILEIVQKRFASLVNLAERLVATINDLTQLRHLLMTLVMAQDVEQARQVLLEFAQ
jgi:predicted transposase YdaD